MNPDEYFHAQERRQIAESPALQAVVMEHVPPAEDASGFVPAFVFCVLCDGLCEWELAGCPNGASHKVRSCANASRTYYRALKRGTAIPPMDTTHQYDPGNAHFKQGNRRGNITGWPKGWTHG